MGKTDLRSVDKTVPEALDDRQQVMVLGRQDELRSGVLDCVHCWYILGDVLLVMERVRMRNRSEVKNVGVDE